MDYTLDQLRAQYARNADVLRQMLVVAERTGRPYRGYTADQLRAKVAQYERLSLNPTRPEP